MTFDDFVAYGIANGANIVSGMPWSFTLNGVPITHENDTCYLLCGPWPQRFNTGEVLLIGPHGTLLVVRD